MRIALAAVLLLVALCVVPVSAGDEIALRAAFVGAQSVDLRTSQVSSVAALRDRVGIAPSSTPVLVKVFDRKTLPVVLRPAFAKPRTAAVTINGRYIAMLRTDLTDEQADVLRHELVHAYISLASPKPLPLWFQEGSAVHFSMGKDRKFYGQPSKDQVGVMVGKTVELPEDYKQKLQTFNYVMQTAGEKDFNKWYKRAVETGNVDPRPLLGIDPTRDAADSKPHRGMPMWAMVLIGVAVVAALIIGYVASKRDGDYY